MQNQDVFATVHPITNFMYFAIVLSFSMTFMHPFFLCASLISSISYTILLNGKKSIKFNLLYMLPLAIMTTSVNTAFNHEGATVLAYFTNGNPLTLESIVYGIGASVMLVSVISWFSCFNFVMTSDKFIYLFGKAIPSLSLLLSMTFRFVPRFNTQIKQTANAQKCIGKEIDSGNIFKRIKNSLTVLSAVTTWALENSIQISDSMKSRGYGLGKRVSFSIYRFDRRDFLTLSFILACGIYVLCGVVSNATYWRYFPTVKFTSLAPYNSSVLLVYFLMCITPIALNIKESIKWRALRSKI